MMTRATVRGLIVAFVLATAGAAGAFLGAAHAHQQRVALTTVLFNERTGNLEVMHKVFVHDAEHAAEEMWGHADIVSDAARQKRFADYVRARFTLEDADGRPIELTPVGHEIEGPYFWVYHEAPRPAAATTLTVDDQILRDFWDDQSNLVNVERGDFLGSLTFEGRAGPQNLAIGRAGSPAAERR